MTKQASRVSRDYRQRCMALLSGDRKINVWVRQGDNSWTHMFNKLLNFPTNISESPKRIDLKQYRVLQNIGYWVYLFTTSLNCFILDEIWSRLPAYFY